MPTARTGSPDLSSGNLTLLFYELLPPKNGSYYTVLKG
jgi:hypothetical protein